MTTLHSEFSEFERIHSWQISERVSSPDEAVQIGIRQAEKVHKGETRDYDRVLFSAAALAQHLGLDVTPLGVHRGELGQWTLSLKPNQVTKENLRTNILSDLKRGLESNQSRWGNATAFSIFSFPNHEPNFGEQAAELALTNFLKEKKIRRNTKKAREVAERNKERLATLAKNAQSERDKHFLSDLKRGIDRNIPQAEKIIAETNNVDASVNRARKLGASADELDPFITASKTARQRAQEHLTFLSGQLKDAESRVKIIPESTPSLPRQTHIGGHGPSQRDFDRA